VKAQTNYTKYFPISTGATNQAESIDVMPGASSLEGMHVRRESEANFLDQDNWVSSTTF